jgi:hypothetical protein
MYLTVPPRYHALIRQRRKQHVENRAGIISASTMGWIWPKA